PGPPLLVRGRPDEVGARGRPGPMQGGPESSLERIMKRPLAALGAAALALTLVAPGAARTDGGGPKPYLVVFTGQSGLPANASKLVSAAGATVTATLPQVGAARASSARADCAAELAPSSQAARSGPGPGRP